MAILTIAGENYVLRAMVQERDAEVAALRGQVAMLREALEPFAGIDTGETDCPDHFTQEETLTVGSIRRARAALVADITHRETWK